MTGFARKGGALLPLSDEEIERIHNGALAVLERTGLGIYDREMMERLESAGCPTEPSRHLVKLPRGLVAQALAQAPRTVTLCGRQPESDLHLGDGRAYARTPGGATRIFDWETGAPRDSTQDDVARCVRLADALPNIHGISMCQVVPLDVPRERMDLCTTEIALANTGKHLFYVCHNEEHVARVIELAAARVGGPDALRARPIISPLCESTSPLRLVAHQAQVLKSFARHGLPLRLHAHPIAGLTAPVTLAGELVMTHAEVLGLVVVAQTLAPGLPVVYGMSSSVPDMKTALNLAGAVEIGLLGAAVAQLARRCGLPCSISSGIDAKMPSAQSVLERLMTTLPPILAGADLINLATTDSKMTFSPEQLVLDDEVMRWIGRYVQGIQIDDETLALDLIHQIGQTGIFTDQPHTARHFRRELLVDGLIRGARLDAQEDLVARARAKLRALAV